MHETEHISIAIVGSGGAGALTAGNFLLEAASLAGWHGVLTRTVGPQIRGGEAAALVAIEACVRLVPNAMTPRGTVLNCDGGA